MKKVGSGDIDDVNRVTPAHLLDAFKDLDAVLYSVLLSCFFPVVRACCEFVARYLRNRKGNRASGGSQTSQANPERHGCPNGSVLLVPTVQAVQSLPSSFPATRGRKESLPRTLIRGGGLSD